VDRKGLPDPALTDQQTYVAPRTPTEEMLAQIWIDVLHVERVGIDDNFFDLGGNSLALIRTLAKVHATIDQTMTLIDLFRFPTIGELAARHDSGTVSAVDHEQLRVRAARRRSKINRAASKASRTRSELQT
jgi:hypothetical protein